MAHECANCGGLCYCDEEDMEHDSAPDDCSHLCTDYADDDDHPVAEDEAAQSND